MTYELNEPVEDDQPPVFQPPRREANRVEVEVHCIRCDYILLGLELTADCPECGTPVERSVRGDQLIYSGPEWVNQLAMGMMWLGIAIITSIGLSCVMGSVGGFIGYQSASSGVTGDMYLMQIIGALIGLAPTALAVWGFWLFTTPEPAETFNESGKGRISRPLARWTAVVTGALSVLGVIAIALFPEDGALATQFTGLPAIIAFFAMLFYARTLALRIPDMALVNQTRVVLWGIGGCYGLLVLTLIVGGTIMLLTASGGGGGSNNSLIGAAMVGAIAMVCVMALLGIALLVFGIWSIVLIFQYHNRFKAVVRAAESV